MPNNTPYSLPKNSKSWQLALDSVSSLLPTGISSADLDALQSLPIFALIVVLPSTSASPVLNVHEYVQAWVDDQPNWALVTVTDDATAERLPIPIADTSTNNGAEQARSITPVSVHRYLLIPTTGALMHPEKKSAAAHIIDEQLTTRLRQKLTEQVNQTADTASTHAEVVDCHILSIGHMLRPHKLACFDMDSTLIEQEVIDELAKAAGIGEAVATITESAMRGEIEFDESFAKRLALLEGLSTDVLDDICGQLTLSRGAKFTLAALKALGYHTVLVSGGFTYFAKHIAAQLGIDEVHANNLDIDSGEVTGYVQMPIVNGERKAMLTAKIAERLGIEMTQVVCIGDGANDLPMMTTADLGIAYQAKPIVQSRADAAINVTGLEGVLYALGYPAPQDSSL
ncbi:phosphoserine phosphatase SerB [Psychrobacter arenosus]|uniref:phosphoserine phosphatase SerB n=1 Tax=Psychrobacter arenosus TaxID=256326 RepID=UPI0019190B74|nr:phosphoserine phosphatase SerB [Psychrobacter arenosus]